MRDPSSRSVTISVKVSRYEAALLKAYALNTTPGKGLRRLIDKHLPKEKQA